MFLKNFSKTTVFVQILFEVFDLRALFFGDFVQLL